MDRISHTNVGSSRLAGPACCAVMAAAIVLLSAGCVQTMTRVTPAYEHKYHYSKAEAVGVIKEMFPFDQDPGQILLVPPAGMVKKPRDGGDYSFLKSIDEEGINFAWKRSITDSREIRGKQIVTEYHFVDAPTGRVEFAEVGEIRAGSGNCVLLGIPGLKPGFDQLAYFNYPESKGPEFLSALLALCPNVK